MLHIVIYILAPATVLSGVWVLGKTLRFVQEAFMGAPEKPADVGHE